MNALRITVALTLIALTFGCAKHGAVDPQPGPKSHAFIGPNWGDPAKRPPKPANLRAVKLSGTQIRLDWDAIPADANQPAAFRLYRKPSPGLNEVYQAFSPSTLTFTDVGLTPDKEYTYYLTAMNVSGESEAAVVAITPSDKPSMPANAAASVVSASEVKFEFDDTSDDELSFLIERKEGSNVISIPLNVPEYGPSKGRRQYLDVSVVAEKTYRYRVKSIGPNGATLGFTDFTAPVTPSNVPSVPSNLSATAQSGVQVLLHWTDTSYNATSFTIHRELSNGSGDVTFETTQTSYTDNSVLPENAYRYRVRANHTYNGTTDSSAFSAAVTAQTPSMDPPVPTQLAAQILAPNRVKLTWNRNGGLASERFEVKYRLAGQNYGSGNLAENLIDPQFEHYPAAVDETQCYKVRAVLPPGLGESPYTPEVCVHTPSGVPENASNLHLQSVSESSAQIAWSGSAPGYRVERRLGSGAYSVIASTAATSLLDSGLQADKGYDYRVRAFNDFGDSPGYSNVLHVNTLPVTPLAPSSLTLANPIPGNAVILTFQNNDGRSSLLGFHVFRRKAGQDWPSGGNPTFVIAGSAPIGPISFSDTTVENDKTYYYRVRAVNAVGDSDYSNVASVHVDQQPDAPVMTGRYRTVGGYKAVLRWSPIAYATGYELQRRVANGSFAVIAGSLSSSTLEYIDSGLTEDVQYTYRIRSKYGSVLSVFSNEVKVKPDKVPSAPSGLQAIVVHAHDAQLRIVNESDNQIGFLIYRKVGSQEVFLVGFNDASAPDAQVNYTLTGLASQTTYNLIIKAFNGWGESEGASITIMTPAN